MKLHRQRAGRAPRHELIKQESTTIFLAHSNAHTVLVSLLVVLFTIVNNLNIIACSRPQDARGAHQHHQHQHQHQQHQQQQQHHHHHQQNNNNNNHHNNQPQSNGHERRHQRAIHLALEQQQQQQLLLQLQPVQQLQQLQPLNSSWPSQQEQPAILDQCCACDEAKYELVFEGLWSKYTHPDDFPENYWLAHFSDIIGASHSNDFRMWGQEALASEGVRELAETGATKRLESELKQVSSKTRTIIKARELRYPTLNSKTSAVFRTDKHHHLVSILSKLGPSPDWMVGVSALELCQSDCSWAAQRTVNLFLWDAGTDSGNTFTSSDSPSRPQERVRPYRRASAAQLSSQTNATMRSLFEAATNNAAAGLDQQAQFDAAGQPQDSTAMRTGEQMSNQAALNNFNRNEVMKPFARLTVTRQRIYEKSCNSADPLATGYNSKSAFSNQQQQQQQQQQQGHFQSAAAGKMDSDIAYEPVRPVSPSYSDCRFTDWTDWSSCSSTCGKGIRTRTRSHFDDQAELAGCSRADLIEKEICLSECLPNGTTCVTRDWSEWSECSVDCGQGYRKRTRSPIGQMRPACGSMELVETEQCAGGCGQAEPAPPACAVSEWSEWSECPVACGTGTKIRFRQLIRREEARSCAVKLIQKQPCTGRPELCKQLSKDARAVPQALVTHQPGQGPRTNPDLPVIDCKLSNWSPWSTCSAVCGNGRRTRSRYVIQMPQNGGKSCDKRLTRTQRCKDLPPCPQNYYAQQQSTTGPSRATVVAKHANQHHHQAHHKSSQTIRSELHRTTTASSSMMDDEDESKYLRLLKSDLGHLQLNGWVPTESDISDGIMAPTEMELIGSSSFQIKNGFIYPFNERERRQPAQGLGAK